jgi:hypothetical protein
MEDISSLLSFEVRKEIADRYFRFRKIIEDDTHNYKQNIITLSLDLESSIGYDLVCIYALLQDEDLLHIFFTISGLSERFFFECDINTSTILRKRIIQGKRVHGLTGRSRFRNFFFDSYESLHAHIADYHQTLCRLSEDWDTIREQINLFYRNNDITGILQFLRNLDGSQEVVFDAQGHIPKAECQCNLDEKLRLHPPDPVEELLPIIAEIPSLKEVRSRLKNLVNIAWSRRPGFDIRRI